MLIKHAIGEDVTKQLLTIDQQTTSLAQANHVWLVPWLIASQLFGPADSPKFTSSV